MIRRIAIRLISLLLVEWRRRYSGGLGGLEHVDQPAGQSPRDQCDGRRAAGTHGGVRPKCRGGRRRFGPGDGRLSRSTTQARASVTEATQTADDLAATFDRLAEGSQVTVLVPGPWTG